jgi:hypothetical protein
LLDVYTNVFSVRDIEQTDVVLMKAISSLRVEEPECNCKAPPPAPPCLCALPLRATLSAS